MWSVLDRDGRLVEGRRKKAELAELGIRYFEPPGSPPSGAEPPSMVYAFEVGDRLMRFSQVRTLLTMAGDALRRIDPGRRNLNPNALKWDARYHLTMHRTLMVTAYDTAIRLIASVWKLGIPERALTNEKIIDENDLMTAELKEALKGLQRIVRPYRADRNNVVHAGNAPQAKELDFLVIHQMAEEWGGGDALERDIMWISMVEDAVKKEVATITAEIADMEKAEWALLTALRPQYERQKRMLLAVEQAGW